MTKLKPSNRLLLVNGGVARRRTTVVVDEINSFQNFECRSNAALKEPAALACRKRGSYGMDQQKNRSTETIDSPSLAVAVRLLEDDIRIEHRSQLSPIVEELKEINSADIGEEVADNRHDSLSYEECLEITEALGSVKQDEWRLLADGEISKLPVGIYNNEPDQSDNKTDIPVASCLVCLQQYETNDFLRQLPCNHIFHISCADQWLLQTNACPCCRKPIDDTS